MGRWLNGRARIAIFCLGQERYSNILFSNWSEKPDVIGSNPILPTFDKALSPNRLRHSTLTAVFTGSSPVGAAMKDQEKILFGLVV